MNPSKHIKPARRWIGWVCDFLPEDRQKRLIMWARLVGILCASDAEAMVAERGLKEA
ncbi:hypothetical protein [Azospirillum rugosum]|uniref:Uncharacterized protein n=1 Tax=Azospirillum rugosum TaxID=416170 RepID=A0ABS4SHY4_9PROT|nr:hypothetical protein [Azospirillum rugosum]MBP2291025.1 hypothetical protein [Azospirillum rugosum]MDQ0524911.1 hypothetical protein [Azospirillum rugosum]